MTTTSSTTSGTLFILIDLSKEMWDSHPDGEQYYDKCLSFLTELFQRFREVHTKHTIIITLYTRLFPAMHPTSSTPTFRSLSPSFNQTYKTSDFIHTISFADRFPFTLLIKRLKQYFLHWKSIIRSTPNHSLSSSKYSSLFESLITVLHHFGSHFRGDISETVLVLTAGTGLYKSSTLLLSLCKRIVLKNYANIQIVSFAAKPLYKTPLVVFTDHETKAYDIPHWIEIRYYQNFTFDAFKLCRSHNCHNCLTVNFDQKSEYFFVPLIKRKCIVKQDFQVPVVTRDSIPTPFKQEDLPKSGASPLRINNEISDKSLSYCIVQSMHQPHKDSWENLVHLQCTPKQITKLPSKHFKTIQTEKYTISTLNKTLVKQLYTKMVANRVAIGFQFNTNTTTETGTILYAPDEFHLITMRDSVYSKTKLLPYHYTFSCISTPPITTEFNEKNYTIGKRTINLQPLDGMDWKLYDNLDSFTKDDDNLDKFHSQIYHISSASSSEDKLASFLNYYEFVLDQCENMKSEKSDVEYFHIEKVFQNMIKDIHGKVSGTTLASWLCQRTTVVNHRHACIVLNAFCKRSLIVRQDNQMVFVDSQNVIYTTPPSSASITNQTSLVERQVQATQSPFHYRSFLVRVACGEDNKENYFLELERTYSPSNHYHVGFYWLNIFMSPRSIDTIIASHSEHFQKNSDLKFVQQILPKDVAIMKSINCKSNKQSPKRQNPINCKFQ
ncbi:Vacuolar membrane-associated protein Iml1 N-terminal domain-containing protein [Entamoeba marina]